MVSRVRLTTAAAVVLHEYVYISTRTLWGVRTHQEEHDDDFPLMHGDIYCTCCMVVLL